MSRMHRPQELDLTSHHTTRSPGIRRKAAPMQDSTNIHSISAFGDVQGEPPVIDGAEIPDIPLRKTSRSVIDYITPSFKPNRKPRFFEESDSRAHNPVSPPPRSPRRGSMNSPRFSHEDLRDHAASQEAEYTHDPVASRSPSTAPKSLMSKSSRSHIDSSASSLAHPHNNGGSSLPALQTRAVVENDGLEPLAEEEIDPASFDLVVPAHAPGKQYSLETQSEQLFSAKHLAVIFEDSVLLQRFTNFIYQMRPSSIPVLQYYMDTLKALKAIEYANAVVKGLSPVNGLAYTADSIDSTLNVTLQQKAASAFETLTNQELPAYVTHIFTQVVSVTIKRRIADTLPPHLREMSEGLAEVFCLTDPARPDNPIIFASEEFHRTTQYGMSYVLGRNCRFLQGPKTNPYSVARLREKLAAGKEHCETFLNYRRDGQPFMNLLMVAPLFDSKGAVRYHIGAQVDVSGLVRDCSGLESLERLVDRENAADGSNDLPIRIHKNQSANNRASVAMDTSAVDDHQAEGGQPDEFRTLASMFSLNELKTVREHGGSMHRIHQSELTDNEGIPSNWNKPRLLIKDDATIDRRDSDPLMHSSSASLAASGKLSGVYEHYLLVRPYPSLKILFASPSLRVPGMLQSNLMSRIGGSSKVREAIAQAFADGNGVTAKVRWITSRSGSGGAADRGRWIHCTPLLGSNGAVGVWMVVLVDDEQEQVTRQPRDAPPVERYIRGAAAGLGGQQQFGGSIDDLSLASLGDGGLNERDGRHSAASSRDSDRNGGGGGGRHYGAGGYETTASLRGNQTAHRRTPALNGLAMHPEPGRYDSM